MFMEINEKEKRYTLSDKALFKRIFKYMRPHVWRYIIGILLVGLSVALDILHPYLTGLALKELGNENIDLAHHILLFSLGVLSAILTASSAFFLSFDMNKPFLTRPCFSASESSSVYSAFSAS